jgi:hypothetical protein
VEPVDPATLLVIVSANCLEEKTGLMSRFFFALAPSTFLPEMGKSPKAAVVAVLHPMEQRLVRVVFQMSAMECT